MLFKRILQICDKEEGLYDPRQYLYQIIVFAVVWVLVKTGVIPESIIEKINNYVQTWLTGC